MLLTDFRFVVIIGTVRVGAFLECTLPTIQWETQAIIEGGQNSFIHQLPTRRKEAVLKLRRGLGLGSEITDWYKAMLAGNYHPKTITVCMIDSLGNDVIWWSIERAFPIKWTGPSLKADGKAVAIETLELACGAIAVNTSKHFDKTTNWLNRPSNPNQPTQQSNAKP